MANAKKTSPARKTYCVWADHVRRVYQHVAAESPKEAHEAAKNQPDRWERCDWHDSNGYRLSNEVQDMATEEFTAVGGAADTLEGSPAYTPGPWIMYADDKDARWEINADVSPLEVRPICAIEGDSTAPEVTANARLIAAAPDLVQACKAVIRGMRAEYLEKWVLNLLDDCERAVAKAEARAPCYSYSDSDSDDDDDSE